MNAVIITGMICLTIIFVSAMIFFIVLSFVFMQHFERLISAAPICCTMAMICKYLEYYYLLKD